jgi:universal stress protein F
MTSPVLCAVDISNEQEDLGVLRRAAQIAALDGAALDVIAVVPDYGMSVVGSFFSQDHHDKMVDDAKSRVNDLVSAALGKEQNQKVRHVVASGRVYEEILRLATQTKAGLIVVGAHKADLKDYLLGPNAARIELFA